MKFFHLQVTKVHGTSNINYFEMIFILGLVICVSFSSVLSNPVPQSDKRAFSIEEAVLGSMSVNTFSGKWISDKEFEYHDKKTNDVNVLNAESGVTSVILKGSVLTKYGSTNYKFSPSRNFVLIAYNESSIFRHTKTAQYVVYSIKEKIYRDVAYKEKLQEADWAPNKDIFVYIKDNNMYLVQNISVPGTVIQLTITGSSEIMYNGISDWVYEEEVLGSSRAFWFSPKGDQIVYLTLNDTNVNKAAYLEYGEPGSNKNQYLEQREIYYPKTGTAIPDYSLWHVALNNTYTSRLVTKTKLGSELFYGLKWADGDDDTLYFVETNRVQNESTTYKYNVKSKKNTMVFAHYNKDGWANTNLPWISKSQEKILKITAINNFNQVVLYFKNGTAIPLTKGQSEVLDILQWDEKNRTVYYLATEANNSTASQVYAVSEEKRSPECITCQIRSPEGRLCRDATALFSKTSSYVVIICNGPDPRVAYLLENKRPHRNVLKVLEDNARVRKQLKMKLLPEIMNLTVEVPGSLEADVRLFLPPNLDKSGATKYPLLIYVYAGPGSKAITDAFKFDWGHYISTNLSIIYGFIDGRNTLRKGTKMLFACYKALGTCEMEDQINVTKYIQKKFQFVDATNTAIWGWSYGGYATTKILEMDKKNVFKCGIAVAPVTDWLYYDSVYTERYMGLPKENQKGYKTASVLYDVTNLRKKQYLLIHGNADDNVHYQNAMMLAKLLERNDIPFDLMSYPDENHSLSNVRKHLYHTMDKFWKKCFNLQN